MRSLNFTILQMSGWGVVTAIASTVLHRKILLIRPFACLLTVCALFSPNCEKLARISNRQVRYLFHGMQHVLTFWIILKLFIDLVY